MASLDENILGWNQNTVGGEKIFKKKRHVVYLFFSGPVAFPAILKLLWFMPKGLSCKGPGLGMRAH